MDREDLDQQLKEHGEAMQKEITGSRKGRMKLFAAALALLVIGSAGGCFFGEFPQIPKRTLLPRTRYRRERIRSCRSCRPSAIRRSCRR